MPTSDFYIVPAASLDATADAIRAKTGSQAAIEYTQDGFADAIEEIPSGYSVDEWLTKTVTGSIVFNGVSVLGSVDGFSSITSFSAPNLKSLWNANYFFRNCTSLASISLPKLAALYGVSLFENTAITYLVLPEATVGNSQNIFFTGNNFNNCPNLKALDCYAVSRFGGNALKNAQHLDTIVIRHFEENNSYRNATLDATTTFDSTPFASDGTGGTLYVPADYVSTFQSLTNWAAILGYANNQIKSIESTHTDPNAPIDLTLYYADGTLIPT